MSPLAKQSFVEALALVFFGVIVVVVLLGAGRARGPNCYMDGCGKPGRHAVRVCDEHTKDKP